MKYWYKGEPFRLFPNFEIWYNDEDELWSVSLVWMKFSVDIPIFIKL